MKPLLVTIYDNNASNIHKSHNVMVLNATFNYISAISWQSVLLVEETGVPRENHRPAATHWQTLLHNAVSSTSRLRGIRTHNVVVICTDWIGSSKPNYHTITTIPCYITTIHLRHISVKHIEDCYNCVIYQVLLLKKTANSIQGRIQGEAYPAPPPPPLKLEKIRFFWREIVIFYTKYPKLFAPPSAIGKK